MADVLTTRALNRATLSRQMLLERKSMPADEAMRRLFALQAQDARPPFVALWSRLAGFERTELLRLLEERAVVRATWQRGTLHLLDAADYLALRSSLQPALSEGWRSTLRERASGVDVGVVVAEAEAFLAGKAATFEALRDHLAALHPDADIRALAYAARLELPLVQPPTGGAWGYAPGGTFTLAREWLGRRRLMTGS